MFLYETMNYETNLFELYENEMGLMIAYCEFAYINYMIVFEAVQNLVSVTRIGLEFIIKLKLQNCTRAYSLKKTKKK